MKTAIYIEDNKTQVVLTPENKWEQNALAMVREATGAMKGNFYECRGGYLRLGPIYHSAQNDPTDESTIFVVNKPPPPPEVI